MQLKFDLLGMLTGPEKYVSRIVFLFSAAKFKMPYKSHVTLKSLTASPTCFKEGPYRGHIRFWCDSYVTFFTWIDKKNADSTVFLYN